MAVQNPFPPIHFSVAIVGALIGMVILLFGRKLFWLCVAAVGFAAGVEIAPHLVHEPSALLQLTGGVVLGLKAFVSLILFAFLATLITWLIGMITVGRRNQTSPMFRFGSLFTLLLEKIGIAAVGFLAGVKLLSIITATFFIQYTQHSTMIFIVGGTVTAILLLFLGDWALIVLSSLVGAYMMQSAINLPVLASTIVFIGLVLVGMIVQSAAIRGRA